MDIPRNERPERPLGGVSWTLGNDWFRLSLEPDHNGLPFLAHLVDADLPHIDWAAGRVVGPAVKVDGQMYVPGSPGMSFLGADVDGDNRQVCLHYRCLSGLHVRHYLQASAERAAWVSWTVLVNGTGDEISGISRFDALRLDLAVGEAEPLTAYLLGWLDGPRLDAPGHHPSPYPYPSWIPRLLYGDDGPVPPPPPPGGWSSPVLRLITERLTRLPLRSGKRSTYDNHPWAAVLDPEREAGLYLGFAWSGTWKIDVEHANQVVSIVAHTDASVHTLEPGASLTSPRAFVGLFAGDWDDAFNACRRYTSGEVLPPSPPGYPYVHYNLGCPRLPGRDEAFMRNEIDLASELGYESVLVDAMWWADSLGVGDFSIGLGDFCEHRGKFPRGLRALSDYTHARGLKFGLWFEFERLDLRTANVGRNPWSPTWLLHQGEQSYRSWCQHVYLACLGTRRAAEWALENIAWAIEAYGVDWVKIDSNEWAICDDAAHDHSMSDGEWAQIHGLYDVLEGLLARFPDLIVENCAGGSQRGDPGMGRFSHILACHDVNDPPAINRQYSHGVGCIYPTAYGLQAVRHRPDYTPEELEWEVLNRMMGLPNIGLELATMGEETRGVLRGLIDTYKTLRPTLHGDRYVLDGPAVLVQPENREADQWEAYEYVSPDAKLASVFFYRCLSPRQDHHVVLKGLDPAAMYRVMSHSGQLNETRSGMDLMTDGLVCHRERPLSADVVILTRL